MSDVCWVNMRRPKQQFGGDINVDAFVVRRISLMEVGMTCILYDGDEIRSDKNVVYAIRSTSIRGFMKEVGSNGGDGIN